VKVNSPQIKGLIGLLLLLTIAFACQRQLYFDETPAEGFLQKDVSGNCKPFTIAGALKTGTPLADTNYLEVEVEITSAGTYNIKSDTVNGYSFSGSGKFDNTGVYMVKLRGQGKPTSAGQNVFTIKFNSSTCQVTLTVLDVARASFSFLGAPDRCRGAVVSGTYIKGVQLDNTNTVKVEVYVTSPGAYSFSSNFVNGYQFSGSGNLPNYGNEILTLTGSGSPANAGIDVFTLNAGFSSCTFVDTVKEANTQTGENHFPTTYNSRWVFDDLMSTGDSVVRRIVDSTIINGFEFKIFYEQDRLGARNFYESRDGDVYLDYGPVDRYTNSVSYQPKVLDEIQFLKEGLGNNEGWTTPTFTGVATFGQTILIRYNFLCTSNNASVIINGKQFNQVYKIQMRPQIASVGGTYGDTGEVYDLYYANNIGLIYYRKKVNGITQTEWNIKRWTVY
jgi:hypothetical protein